MDDGAPTRRRLLRAASIAGVGAVAGCLGGGPATDPGYTCTQLDEEPTERVAEDGSAIPFTFERPSILERQRDDRYDSGGRTEYRYRWTGPNPRRGRERPLRFDLYLRLRYVERQSGLPTLGLYREDEVAIDKYEHDGEVFPVVEHDDGGWTALLASFVPQTRSGERVYDRLTVEAEPILRGPEEVIEAAAGDDAEQTCGEAMRAVARSVVGSVEAFSEVETETTLSLSPSSATVRPGETVEVTMEAAGVDWVELTIGQQNTAAYNFLGAMAAPDEAVSVTIAPPAGGSDVVIVPDGVELDVVNSVGDFTPGEYQMRVSGPGDGDTVSATTTLTVPSE